MSAKWMEAYAYFPPTYQMRCGPMPSTGMKPISRGFSGFEMSYTRMPAVNRLPVPFSRSAGEPPK